MLTDFCTCMYILNARATSKKSVNGLMAKSKKSCFLYAISTYFAFLYIIINSKAEESERKTKKIYLVMWKCDAQIWKLVDNTYTYSFKASTESSAHTLSFFFVVSEFLKLLSRLAQHYFFPSSSSSSPQRKQRFWIIRKLALLTNSFEVHIQKHRAHSVFLSQQQHLFHVPSHINRHQIIYTQSLVERRKKCYINILLYHTNFLFTSHLLFAFCVRFTVFQFFSEFFPSYLSSFHRHFCEQKSRLRGVEESFLFFFLLGIRFVSSSTFRLLFWHIDREKRASVRIWCCYC